MFASTFSSSAFNAYGGWRPAPPSFTATAPNPFPRDGTRQVHIGGTASWGGSVTASVGVAVDSKGGVAVTVTGGIGGGTPGIAVEAGVTTTNAESVDDLSGASGTTSVGGGAGVVASVSTVAGANYTGVTTSVGVGAGPPISASAHVTGTYVANVTEQTPPPPPPCEQQYQNNCS